MTQGHDHSAGENLSESLGALDAISHLLTSTLFDLDTLLEEIVRITAQKLGVKACAIRLLDEESGKMVLKAVYGLSEQYLSKGPVIAADSGFRTVMESGRPLQILDVRDDPDLHYSTEALAEGIRSRLIVGLVRDNQAIGALSVFTDHPHRFRDEEVQIFQTIANQAAVAIHLARMHRERLEARRVEQELAIAAEIQTNLMPLEIPELKGFDIAARAKPCREIGGDFYDFIELPEANLGIAVGDVSGKGIPAALLMASVSSALRVQAESIYAMREAIGRVNRALCRHTHQEQFVTLFYGVLNSRERVLTYVNAGHNFPLLFRGDEVLELKTGGRPLGFFPDGTYWEETVRLRAGDLLVLYTDGFIDAQNREGEFFEEERLRMAAREHSHLDAQRILEGIEETVARFEAGTTECIDDRTLVVLRVEG